MADRGRGDLPLQPLLTVPCAAALVARDRFRGGFDARGAVAGASLLAGALVLPLAFELATRAVQCLVPDCASYLQEFRGQFDASLGGYSRTRSIAAYYGVHWIRTEGPLFTVLSLAGAAWLVLRARGTVASPAFLCLGGLILVPHLMYAVPALKGARTLLMAVPAACLAVGFVLARGMGQGTFRARAAWGIAAGFLLAWPLKLTLETARGKGPYREVLAFVETPGGFPVTIDDYPILYTYTRGADLLIAQKEGRAGASRSSGSGLPRQAGLLSRAVRKDGRYGFEDAVWSERTKPFGSWSRTCV